MAERSLCPILIVDDDQQIARLVRTYFSGPGIGLSRLPDDHVGAEPSHSLTRLRSACWSEPAQSPVAAAPGAHVRCARGGVIGLSRPVAMIPTVPIPSGLLLFPAAVLAGGPDRPCAVHRPCRRPRDGFRDDRRAATVARDRHRLRSGASLRSRSCSPRSCRQPASPPARYGSRAPSSSGWSGCRSWCRGSLRGSASAFDRWPMWASAWPPRADATGWAAAWRWGPRSASSGLPAQARSWPGRSPLRPLAARPRRAC